jgi:hypothetical protein
MTDLNRAWWDERVPLHEDDYTLFPRWPLLEKDGDSYRFPAGQPRLPLMYSRRARAG